MKTLTIFHDPRCGLCAGFKQWLDRQPKYVAASFVPFNSPAAAERFPGLGRIGADRDIVVLADDNRWWQGEPAWIICLWITRGYRPWAYRFAGPLLRPVVRKAVHLLSENRFAISRLLRLSRDEQLAAAIHSAPGVGTTGGTCDLNGGPFKFNTPPPLPK